MGSNNECYKSEHCGVVHSSACEGSVNVVGWEREGRVLAALDLQDKVV